MLVRFLGGVEPIAELDPLVLAAVVEWITSIPLEDWGQQKPHGVLPLKPAMMSNHTWHGFGAATDAIVSDLLALYPGCIAQQRMLGCVMPGDEIPPHIDHQCEQWLERVHVPLTTNADASFVVEDVPYHMRVGWAYRVNTEARHAVFNRGTMPRIHFMFDVRGA